MANARSRDPLLDAARDRMFRARRDVAARLAEVYRAGPPGKARLARRAGVQDSYLSRLLGLSPEYLSLPALAAVARALGHDLVLDLVPRDPPAPAGLPDVPGPAPAAHAACDVAVPGYPDLRAIDEEAA
jgi:hypothetical protein